MASIDHHELDFMPTFWMLADDIPFLKFVTRWTSLFHVPDSKHFFFRKFYLKMSVLFSPQCVNSLCNEGRIYASVNYAIIGSDNGLSPARRQAIIWTNAGILLIGPLGTNFSEIFIKIKTFSLTNLHLKVLSAKVAAILSRPQCVNLMFPR